MRKTLDGTEDLTFKLERSRRGARKILNDLNLTNDIPPISKETYQAQEALNR